MPLKRKIHIILITAGIFLLVCPVAGLWATTYTFSEKFETTDHQGPGTTAVWDYQELRLPASTDPLGNTKQVNGSITIMGDYLYYAWVDFRGGIGTRNGHIYLQRYDKSGNNPLAADVLVDHGSPSTYIPDGFFATYVKLINDGSNVYVYWTVGNCLYLQKFNAAAECQWTGDLQLNTSPAMVSSYNYGYFTGLVNSDRTLSFFWDGGSVIYMQKVNPDGPGGILAGDPIQLLSSNVVDLAKVSRDSDDNYFMIYSSYNSTNTNRELFINKYKYDDFSGIITEVWADRVFIVSMKTIYGTDIATDASGKSYVVWDQLNSTSGMDVYIKAFDTSGNELWPAQKVYNDTSYYNQTNPKVRLDSANLPNVIWEDTRTTSKLNVYAQRYNAIGEAQWASTGVKVNVGDNPYTNALYYTGYNSNFVIDTDNSLYVTWHSYRNSDYDLFGQKITTAGTNNASDWTITQIEAGGGYALSAEAVSDDVLYPDNPVNPILSAKAYGSYYSQGQTIKLYLSNDGTTWQSANMNGAELSFTNTTGTSLYWKAEISTNNLFVSPIMYSILIEYRLAGEGSAYHKTLYIYDDDWRYPPSGWMDEKQKIDSMLMDSASHENPATGSSCVKITYDPAKEAWAGFYVQASGEWRANGGKGIDLSNYSAMLIRAKAGETNAQAILVQFGVGGDRGGTGDTCAVKTRQMILSNEWQTYAIDLTNQILTDVNGLLLVVMTPAQMIDPSFYIDDIKFIGPGPSSITDLQANYGNAPGDITLTWTAPDGDYLNTGYIVKYSTGYISNWEDYSQSLVPGTPGTTETQALSGLTPGQGYYFAVQTIDEKGNLSDKSNIFYALARTAGIGIKVEGLADLGEMLPGESKTALDPVTVTNIGGVPVTLSLNLVNPPGWQAAMTPGMNQYVLLGAFGSASGAVMWDNINHLLTNRSVKCTSVIYAGDQNGVGVPLDAQRKLWLRLTAPLAIDIGTGIQTIIINVTAGQ